MEDIKAQENSLDKPKKKLSELTQDEILNLSHEEWGRLMAESLVENLNRSVNEEIQPKT